MTRHSRSGSCRKSGVIEGVSAFTSYERSLLSGARSSGFLLGMLKPREQKRIPGFGCAAVVIQYKLLFIVARNISLAQDRWHSARYTGSWRWRMRNLSFFFPGAFRLLKLSWKSFAPDLGFIKVLWTIQTYNRSQPALVVEGNISIGVRLTVLYRLWRTDLPYSWRC
jgi:hypothetical protein